MAYATARNIDFTEIPIIDAAPLIAGHEAGVREVGRQIHRAAIDVGFFYIRNHGVPAQTMADVFAMSRRFFALPAEDKRAAKIDALHRGWLAQGEAQMYGKEKPDLKESFLFGLDLPPDDPDVRAGKTLLGPNNWPPALPDMRAVLDRYYRDVGDCGRRLLRGFAAAIGLPLDYFTPKFAKPMARGSLVYYPPQPPDLGESQFGVAPHTDYGCLTLVAQDMNGGLQVKNRAGEWVAAHPIADTFVVNIGDLLARWTNDLYVSNPHRVVNVSGRTRYSVALFFDPHPDTEIAVLDACRRPGEAEKYPRTTCGEYITVRFDEAFKYRKQKAV